MPCGCASPSPTPASATVPAGAGTPCRAGRGLAREARSPGRRTTPSPLRRGVRLSCGCQLTPEERAQAWEELTRQLDSLDLDTGIRSGEADLAQQAEKLGVTAQWRRIAAPFVTTGNVDGRGFSLCERHGYYRVTIAPDDDPAADLWELPAERATLYIADGEDDDLSSARMVATTWRVP